VTERAQIHAWMTAAAEGDRAVLEPLFDALWAIAVAYAERLLTGDRALAEDCAQDALVRLFAQLEHFDPSRDGLTWALTIVTWSCRTARRRRTREHARTGQLAREPSSDGVNHAVERDLVRNALATLAALAPADVDTISAAVLDDRSPEITGATFRKRLQRSIERLRTA